MARSVDGSAPAAQAQALDLVGHRRCDLEQAIRQPVDQLLVAAQDADRDPEVGFRLRRQGRRVGGSRVVHALVLDAIAGHELLAHRPELGGVELVRDAVAGEVELAVAAPLTGSEPRHAWDTRRVVAAARLEHRPRDRAPCHALGSAGRTPPVRREPIRRRPVDDRGGRPLVDAEVVPVDEEDQVGQAQPPGRVLRLVGGAGRQPAFALDYEHLDLIRARQLEGQGFARGKRHAVAGRTRVRLQKESPAGHLGVAGQPAPVPQAQEMLPRQGETAVFGERITGIAGPLGAGAKALVQNGESGVDERHDVTGGEHEAIAEAKPRAADVPAHRPGHEQRYEHVDLGPRAAGMPALAVVELQVDALVDQVLEDFVTGKVLRREGVQATRIRAGGDLVYRHRAATALAASGSTTVRVRLTASAMFSRELA